MEPCRHDIDAQRYVISGSDNAISTEERLLYRIESVSGNKLPCRKVLLQGMNLIQMADLTDYGDRVPRLDNK